mmetsp:Transcript_15979/g.2237  ORF Transcript_15979/g.2237 Transcript_15979/m.2237 type:complete len:81 (+) Transcript_15979:98-340(+)
MLKSIVFYFPVIYFRTALIHICNYIIVLRLIYAQLFIIIILLLVCFLLVIIRIIIITITIIIPKIWVFFNRGILITRRYT